MVSRLLGQIQLFGRKMDAMTLKYFCSLKKTLDICLCVKMWYVSVSSNVKILPVLVAFR